MNRWKTSRCCIRHFAIATRGRKVAVAGPAEHLSGAVVGGHLRVCEYRERTCCSYEMESTMKARGLSELIRSVADRIVLSKQIFLSRAAKFDGIVTSELRLLVGN